VLVPAGESVGLLGTVGSAVIDARNACPVTGDVINDRLDHMRQDANAHHSGYSGAPQIMMHPWGNRLAVRLGDGGIEQSLFKAVRLGGEKCLAAVVRHRCK